MNGLKKGVAWYGLRGRAGRPISGAVTGSVGGSSGVRWAVRRDWPDGVHEFIRDRDSEASARRQADRDRAYWCRAPMRPLLSVVRISARDFALHGRHRRGCASPDCPREVPVAVVGSGAA